MSDPRRVAVLAEALRGWEWPSEDQGPVLIIPGDATLAAAAVLAILPPMAWDDLSYEAGLEDGRKESGAEIDRLRPIEEAARAYLSRPSSPALLDALRAALEQKP